MYYIYICIYVIYNIYKNTYIYIYIPIYTIYTYIILYIYICIYSFQSWEKTVLHLISVMLKCQQQKKALNKSTRFEIKTKSVYTTRDEGFNQNSVSTSRKKLLPLTGISAKSKKMVSTSRNNVLL